MTLRPLRAPYILLALCSACPGQPGDSSETTEASETSGSSGSTGLSVGETSATTVPTGSSGADSTSDATGTGETSATGDPDPAYRRECQASDFVCDDWGCPRPPDVVDGECYKPCSPDGEIGGPDPECDEPERPFCSQIGLSLGGDYDCNGCAHICVSASLNVCEQGKDQCG